MKVLCMLLAAALLLCGCSAAPTFETIAGACNSQEFAQEKSIRFSVPEDAAAQVISSNAGKLYLCDGYEITVQTLAGTDIDTALRQLTGFDSQMLTLMQTKRQELDCYECVWTAAGEGSDMVARAVVLSDGSYHYCVTVMAQQEQALGLQETWQGILGSVSVA